MPIFPSSQTVSHPDPLRPFLAHAGVMILDGALATELEKRGAHIQNDPL